MHALADRALCSKVQCGNFDPQNRPHEDHQQQNCDHRANKGNFGYTCYWIRAFQALDGGEETQLNFAINEAGKSFQPVTTNLVNANSETETCSPTYVLHHTQESINAVDDLFGPESIILMSVDARAFFLGGSFTRIMGTRMSFTGLTLTWYDKRRLR